MALTTESALRKDRTNANGGMDTVQHRHFAAIAGILHELTPARDKLSLSRTTHQYICRLFADRLASSNPRFDRSRFLRACGIEE